MIERVGVETRVEWDCTCMLVGEWLQVGWPCPYNSAGQLSVCEP